MERRARPWLAVAATLSASLVAAIVLTTVKGWGEDDIGAFLYWTVPFALLLGLATRLAGPRWPVPVAVVGAAAGLLWTVVVALLLGPFFLAFGFPVVLGWMAGGAVGLLAGMGLRSPRALRIARVGAYGTLMLLVLLVALTSVLAQFLWGPDLVAHVRAGTSDAETRAFIEKVVLGQSGVVSVTQNDPLVLEIELADDATDEERRRLRSVLEESPLVERVDGEAENG
jgi:hypothetical protein